MNALLQHHAEFFGNAVDVRCIGLRLIRPSLSVVGPCTVPMPRDNPTSLPARACTQRTSRNSPDRPTVTHVVCALHDSRSALEQVTAAISERSALFQSDRAGRSSVAGRTKKNPGTLVGLVLADKRLTDRTKSSLTSSPRNIGVCSVVYNRRPPIRRSDTTRTRSRSQYNT